MEKITMSIFLVINSALICYGFKEQFGYNSKWFDMPDTCEELNYCKDRGQYYPTVLVDTVLRKVLKSQQRIGEEIDYYQNRIKDSPSEPECETNEIKFDTPIYYIRDKNHKTRVVVQSEKYDFWQKYEIRWCKNVGHVNRTLNFGSVTLSRVNMTCNNVMTTLDFQVLTSDHLDMELISAEMPVFCKARYDKLPSSS